LVLAELFLTKGIPKHIRSDNGPEFVAKKLVKWLDQLEVGPLFIEPGSPWENGYCESFNGKMRYEFLNGEIFYSLFEAQVLIEKWRQHYNTVILKLPARQENESVKSFAMSNLIYVFVGFIFIMSVEF
jgi:transposase InsO family protein